METLVGLRGRCCHPLHHLRPGVVQDEDDKLRLRKQYVHAVDVVPTLYDMVGVTPPDVVRGYSQNPIEGVSFKYTFDPKYALPAYQYAYALPDNMKPTDEDGNILKVREKQFYSMLGTRGVWHKGWHACTVHAPTPSDWGNFDQDNWELYCMDGATLPAEGTLSRARVGPGPHPGAEPRGFDADSPPGPARPSRRTAPHPRLIKKLKTMQSMWFTMAGVYNGMPLDDRATSDLFGGERPQLAPPPFTDDDDNTATADYTYYPGGAAIPEAVAPSIRTCSYMITATVDFGEDDRKKKGAKSGLANPDSATGHGAMFAHGGRFGGHSFYLHYEEVSGQTRLCYVYNWLGQRAQRASWLITPRPTGTMVLRVKFEKTGANDPGGEHPEWGGSVFGNVKLFSGTSVATLTEQTPEFHQITLETMGSDWVAWTPRRRRSVHDPTRQVRPGRGPGHRARRRPTGHPRLHEPRRVRRCRPQERGADDHERRRSPEHPAGVPAHVVA